MCNILYMYMRHRPIFLYLYTLRHNLLQCKLCVLVSFSTVFVNKSVSKKKYLHITCKLTKKRLNISDKKQQVQKLAEIRTWLVTWSNVWCPKGFSEDLIMHQPSSYPGKLLYPVYQLYLHLKEVNCSELHIHPGFYVYSYATVKP